MKFFGYGKDEDALLDLSEVCVQASANELIMLANFILKCADEIRQDSLWEHEHYSGNNSCGFIVFNAAKDTSC